MDSRLIFTSTTKLSHTLQWADWIHIGTGSELKVDLLLESIVKIFPPKKLLLVRGRTNSIEIDKEKVFETISSLFDKEDFQLWDLPMTICISFNKIGVMRVGKKSKP